MPPLATVLTFGFPAFHPPTILALYRRAGCTVGQFYRNPSNPPDLGDVKQICDDAGLGIDSIHGLFGNEYDPSSPDDATRRFAIDTYRNEAQVALELGGPMIVVHPSPLLPEASIDPANQALHEAPLRRSLEELTRLGEEAGVVYLIENLPPNTPIGSDTQALAEMIRAIGSPHLRMCFDVGHAYIAGPIAPQLAACADTIDYLHIHDNDGREDTHLMPGDGSIDWGEMGEDFVQRQIKAAMMLEVFYSAEQLGKKLASGLSRNLVDWLKTKSD